MRKLITIVLVSAFAVSTYAAQLHQATERVSAALNKHYVPQGELISTDMSQSSSTNSLRDGVGVLVDSSQNGYGLLISETNPISVNPYNTDQITMAYRQYTDGSASGSIGMAYSEDAGVNWTTYSNLNFGLSTAGRYPSALAGEEYPVVLWNEYGGGGGTYEGRAYYSFDEFGYGGGFWYPAIDIHNNPLANDSWIVVPTQNVDADGNYILNAVVADWSGDRDRIHFRAQTAGAWDGTELEFSSAYTIVQNARDFLFEGDANYTANGNLDINSDGIGYYVLSSYWNDSLSIANHTLFAKKTSDYGASWSGWFHIPDEALNNYFWDVFPDSIPDETSESGWAVLPDGWTPFIGYDMEVLADEDGGLHILTTALPSGSGGVYPGWSDANGLYHFYAAADAFAGSNGPFIPEISFIGSMQLGWLEDTPDWQSNVVNVAYDLTYPDMLYTVYYTVSDTETVDGNSFSYVDIMGSYSNDNGANWTVPENISQTADGALDETHPHLNRFGIGGHVYMMYQMPDYDHATVSPPDVTADYLNRVYFMDYDFAPVVSVDDTQVQPASFALNDNYPNPFNPSTMISFTLPEQGLVRLSVFDIAGREVQVLQQGMMSAGQHEFTFNGADLASGAYFYRLESQGYQAVKKMLLVK